MTSADDRMKEARAATESIRRRQEREGAEERLARVRGEKNEAAEQYEGERVFHESGRFVDVGRSAAEESQFGPVYESEAPRAGRDVPEFGALELDGPSSLRVGGVDVTDNKAITVEFYGYAEPGFTLGLPKTSEERKNTPMATGLLDYFPDALAEVARVSKAGNDKHNPGEPLHWARGKSMDHADCIVRHLAERGSRDLEGVRHSASVAWRALALLQEELEAEGAPLPRGAWEPRKADPVPGARGACWPSECPCDQCEGRPEVPSCTYEDGQCHRMDCPC